MPSLQIFTNREEKEQRNFRWDYYWSFEWLAVRKQYDCSQITASGSTWLPSQIKLNNDESYWKGNQDKTINEESKLAEENSATLLGNEEQTQRDLREKLLEGVDYEDNQPESSNPVKLADFMNPKPRNLPKYGRGDSFTKNSQKIDLIERDSHLQLEKSKTLAEQSLTRYCWSHEKN
jgi:hypothetical protein